MSQLLPRTQDTLERGLSRVPVNPDTGKPYTVEDAYARMPQTIVAFPGALDVQYFATVPIPTTFSIIDPVVKPEAIEQLDQLLVTGTHLVISLKDTVLERLEQLQEPYALVYPAMNARDVYLDYLKHEMHIPSERLQALDQQWVQIIEWASRAHPYARSICLSKFEFAPAFGHPKYWYDAPPKGNN